VGCGGSHSGQPGTGDEFFRWAFESQYASCFLVQLTLDEERVYREFPDIDELKDFHRDDRVFVATALACQPTAEIFNAVDSDYRQSSVGFGKVGITIIELCPDCVKS
jgi:hypothetical protein